MGIAKLLKDTFKRKPVIIVVTKRKEVDCSLGNDTHTRLAAELKREGITKC